jgi:hypothetical protein
MSEKQVFIIRPGAVRYLDLCLHENESRSKFFSECGLKELTFYGLIMESDDLVKCWHNDDHTDDSEGAGIVIPRSCVVGIVYFKEDQSALAPTVDPGDDIN